MQSKIRDIASFALLLLTATTTSSPTDDVRDPLSVDSSSHNANHIFNAIHSSMRQWGSSWNHNGMSFFLATVPANTEFYHGTKERQAIKGTQWLAFEPEHALTFALRPSGPGRGGPGGPPGSQPPPPPPPASKHQGVRPPPHNAQRPLHSLEDGHSTMRQRSETPGYLHTYRTKHALSLVYIDGLSGGKSSIGTLDSQDCILCPPKDQNSTPRGPMDDHRRANDLCHRAAHKWHGKIDGFIRMEMGFEIILCDFAKDLDFLSAVRVQDNDAIPRDSPIWDQSFAWYRSIATRFDGVGYDRVTLNYDDFTTAYTNPGLGLFANDTVATGPVPRLLNISTTDLSAIRHDVDDMVLRNIPPSSHAHTNWQAVTDMIVTRYGTAIPYLASLTNDTDVQQNIEMLMRPFINYASRDLDAEIDRCTKHFLPVSVPTETKSKSTARDAVTTVSHRICSTLLSTLYPPSAITQNITQLLTYLSWTTWRRCTDVCGYDEVCFIPIWPMGTVADRERGVGRCVNATVMREHGMGPGFGRGHGDQDGKDRSYWMGPGEDGGGPGGPPGEGGDGGRGPPPPRPLSRWW